MSIDEVSAAGQQAGSRASTLADVARVAGVSRATASRVLSGGGAASESARRRVTAAAAHLGYAPDTVARALATGRGSRLVVAVCGQTATVLHDPYVAQVVGAAATVGAGARVGVSLHWLPVDAPAEVLTLAADRSVRAVVLVNTTGAVLRAVPHRLHRRIASIGVGSAAVPSFDVDNAGATDAVLRHLLAAGRRRVAMIGGPHWLPCAGRQVAAYRRLMREAGMPVRLVAGDFSAARGRTAARALLERWPDTDAVVASNDAAALGALAALRDRGADVPGDVAVAGFDDIPFAVLSAPSLTTASHPVSRIAAAAATAVLAETRVPPATVFPSALIRRESA